MSSIAVLLVALLLGSAVLPATVVAQEDDTQSNPIPEEIRSIIQSDMSTVTQEQLQTVQEWYSANSDSLPKPAKERVSNWITEAQRNTSQSSNESDSESSQYTGPKWDSTAQTTYGFPERWDGNVRVYHVEFDVEEGVARVYVETDEPTTVVVADGTQTQSGAQLKTISQVDGRKILSVQMRNPSRKHISVTADRGTWLAFGEDNFNFLPAAEYRIIVLLLGILVSMGTILALEQFANRHDQEPIREV